MLANVTLANASSLAKKITVEELPTAWHPAHMITEPQQSLCSPVFSHAYLLLVAECTTVVFANAYLLLVA